MEEQSLATQVLPVPDRVTSDLKSQDKACPQDDPTPPTALSLRVPIPKQILPMPGTQSQTVCHSRTPSSSDPQAPQVFIRDPSPKANSVHTRLQALKEPSAVEPHNPGQTCSQQDPKLKANSKSLCWTHGHKNPQSSSQPCPHKDPQGQNKPAPKPRTNLSETAPNLQAHHRCLRTPHPSETVHARMLKSETAPIHLSTPNPEQTCPSLNPKFSG